MKTALFATHQELGAKIVDFCGWEMPLHYGSALKEHLAVRQSCGVFDVSHMGRVCIFGKNAEAMLEWAACNDITSKNPLTAVYTVLCAEDGGSIDDVIIYKNSSEDFFVVVNAGNRNKDLMWFESLKSGYGVSVEPLFKDHGIVAVQGPKAAEIVARLLPESTQLGFMRFCHTTFCGQAVALARCGYTGEDGFELYGPQEATAAFFKACVDSGAAPIGLAARDSLRLEMGYALYGHELSDTICPLESVSYWTVRMKKGLFCGKNALENKKSHGRLRRQRGFVLSTGLGIAREGCRIFQNDQNVGIVTSGGHSPALNAPIAIGLLDAGSSDLEPFEIELRQNRIPAKLSPFPFLQKKGS